MSTAWFEPKLTLQTIRELAASSTESVKIAVGYFTLGGWNLIRQHLEEKKVLLLIGKDEESGKSARKLLTDKLLEDLVKGEFSERYQTVIDIVERIKNGRLGVFDARSSRHHGKFYLFDERYAILGSANFSVNGLLRQIEACTFLDDPRSVNALVEKFNYYFEEAEDLTQEVLQILEQWLTLASPWEVYLGMVSLVQVKPEFKTHYSRIPSDYQKHAISSCLEQLQKYNGSMLIASTGLGKTVIAMHVAIELRSQQEVDGVIIFGPAQGVELNWAEHRWDAGLFSEYIGLLALDSEQENIRIRDLHKVENLQKKDDFKLLVIIDESHILRNRRNRKKRERLAYKRVRQLCEKPGTKVLLMTATPYAKGIENINNQLYLLPHTNPVSQLLFDDMEGAKVWRIEQISDFNNLSVVTQMTTAHVSQYYSELDNKGHFVLRGQDKVYVPNLALRTYRIKPTLYNKVEELIELNLFKIVAEEGVPNYLAGNILRIIKVALTSSPPELQRVLKSIAETGDEIKEDVGYQFNFAVSQEERRITLSPILEELDQYNNVDYAVHSDKKLQHLLNIINSASNNRLKVIVFAERHLTVSYLEKNIKAHCDFVNVASTVEIRPGGECRLKTVEEVQQLITRFAPEANGAAVSDDDFNVFIATDAHGVGLNMQDAQIVVNYDISWTPIEPTQRAGRILRFTPNPRTIEVFTFFPGDVDATTEMGSEIAGLFYQEKQGLLNLQRRSDNLIERHEVAQDIVKIPILTESDLLEVDLTEGVKAEKPVIVDWEAVDEVTGLKTSPLFEHFAITSRHEQEVRKLGKDLVSAKESSLVKAPILLVALSYEKKIHYVAYSPQKRKIQSNVSLTTMFEYAQCEPDTPLALVPREAIEQASTECLRKWANENKKDINQVERKFTLCIVPESRDEEGTQYFSNILESQMSI